MCHRDFEINVGFLMEKPSENLLTQDLTESYWRLSEIVENFLRTNNYTYKQMESV